MARIYQWSPCYNRENIAVYYWNEHEKKQDEMLQWSMLPIFGIEFEF